MHHYFLTKFPVFVSNFYLFLYQCRLIPTPFDFDFDHIPTFLLQQVSATILPIITTIVNLYISTGTFVIHFKQSLCTPVLKKLSLDKDTLNNYLPISNQSLISKITERIVKSHLNTHLSSNSLYNHNQSAYIKHHSTETTLLSLHDHLITAISHQHPASAFSNFLLHLTQ